MDPNVPKIKLQASMIEDLEELNDTDARDRAGCSVIALMELARDGNVDPFKDKWQHFNLNRGVAFESNYVKFGEQGMELEMLYAKQIQALANLYKDEELARALAKHKDKERALPLERLYEDVERARPLEGLYEDEDEDEERARPLGKLYEDEDEEPGQALAKFYKDEVWARAIAKFYKDEERAEELAKLYEDAKQARAHAKLDGGEEQARPLVDFMTNVKEHEKAITWINYEVRKIVHEVEHGEWRKKKTQSPNGGANVEDVAARNVLRGVGCKGAKNRVLERKLEEEFRKGGRPLLRVTRNALPVICPGRTALHMAAANGNAEIVRAICEVKDVDVNKRDVFGYTPLHLACYSTHPERTIVIKILLAHPHIDANAAAEENRYSTPLHLAVKARSQDVVDTLLDTIGYVGARSKEGWTPLHLAVKLLANGRDQTANAEAKSIIRTLIKFINKNCPETINTPDEEKKTPLHTSVESVNYELVDLLLDQGEKLNPELKDTDGKTPLDIAIQKGDYRMVQKLQNYLECVGLYGDQKAYADAASAILVVAALIATVTFNAWSQIPVPESNLFWVFSSLSFYFAVATLLSGAGAAMPSRGSTLANVRSAVYAASVCLTISLSSVIGAFTTAAFVFAPLRTHDQRKVIATTAVGGCACLYFLVGFVRKLAKAYSPLFLYADYTRKAFVYKYVTKPLASKLPETNLAEDIKAWYKDTVVNPWRRD